MITDEETEISKGLLFYFFKNKANVYSYSNENNYLVGNGKWKDMKLGTFDIERHIEEYDIQYDIGIFEKKLG